MLRSLPCFTAEPDYIGPAAIAKLERFAFDSRDERTKNDLNIIDDDKVYGDAIPY